MMERKMTSQKSDYDSKAVARAFEDGLDQDMENMAKMDKRIKQSLKAADNKPKPLPPPKGPFRNI